MRRVPRVFAAGHSPSRRLAQRVRPDDVHPRKPAAADRSPGHGVSARFSCRRTWSRCCRSTSAGRPSVSRRRNPGRTTSESPAPVLAPQPDHAGHAGHAGRLARAASSISTATSGSTCSGPTCGRGSCFAGQLGEGRQRVVDRREHPAPGARHAGRRRSRRRPGSARRRSRRVLSGRSPQRRRHLAPGLRQRQIRRLLAGRLAACGRCRDGRFQRRRQERPRRGRVRMAQDRADRDSREPDDERLAAVVHDPHHRSARRRHSDHSGRSEPRRQDGFRDAARPGARDRARRTSTKGPATSRSSRR